MGENLGILITAISALVVALFGAVNTLIGKKARGPADDQAARRDTIADRDGLISLLNERIDDLEERVDKTEKEVKEVRTLNDKLKAALYRVLSILRENDLLDRIRPGDIPDDIHY